MKSLKTFIDSILFGQYQINGKHFACLRLSSKCDLSHFTLIFSLCVDIHFNIMTSFHFTLAPAVNSAIEHLVWVHLSFTF